MGFCIYCRCDSSASVGVPHILPEALTRNGLVLPVGVECDRCNQYAGRRLDENLIRFPLIAMAIQVLGAPGKKGKTRHVVGGVRRERVDSELVRVAFKVQGRMVPGEDGSLAVKARLSPAPGFDFRRFRRALHHIALNAVVKEHGWDAALDHRYDRARQYIRNPRPATDSWPFGLVARNLNPIPRMIAGGFIAFDEVEVFAIYIFHLVFLVDLLQTGILQNATRLMGGTFIPADAARSPEVILTAGGRPTA